MVRGGFEPLFLYYEQLTKSYGARQQSVVFIDLVRHLLETFPEQRDRIAVLFLAEGRFDSWVEKLDSVSILLECFPERVGEIERLLLDEVRFSRLAKGPLEFQRLLALFPTARFSFVGDLLGDKVLGACSHLVWYRFDAPCLERVLESYKEVIIKLESQYSKTIANLVKRLVVKFPYNVEAIIGLKITQNLNQQNNAEILCKNDYALSF